MPTPPLEGPKPGILCLACGKSTLVLSADNESWACDKCKRAFSREAVEEIERLQAIVDKLPVTADGVRVVPGMIAYAFINGEVFEILAVDFYMTCGPWYVQVGVYDICIEDELFAEREAAEAAKVAGGE